MTLLQCLVDTPDDIKEAYKNSNLFKAPSINDRLGEY